MLARHKVYGGRNNHTQINVTIPIIIMSFGVTQNCCEQMFLPLKGKTKFVLYDFYFALNIVNYANIYNEQKTNYCETWFKSPGFYKNKHTKKKLHSISHNE